MASDRDLVTTGAYIKSYICFHMLTLKFTFDDLSRSK